MLSSLRASRAVSTADIVVLFIIIKWQFFLISLVYVLFYILRLNSTDHRLSFFATTMSIENLKTLNRDNRECVDSHKRPKRINLCPTSTAVKTNSANADKCLSCRGVRVYFCDRGSVTHRHWETSYTFSQTPIYLTCSAGFSFDNRKSGLSKQSHSAQWYVDESETTVRVLPNQRLQG